MSGGPRYCPRLPCTFHLLYQSLATGPSCDNLVTPGCDTTLPLSSSLLILSLSRPSPSFPSLHFPFPHSQALLMALGQGPRVWGLKRRHTYGRGQPRAGEACRLLQGVGALAPEVRAGGLKGTRSGRLGTSCDPGVLLFLPLKSVLPNITCTLESSKYSSACIPSRRPSSGQDAARAPVFLSKLPRGF